MPHSNTDTEHASIRFLLPYIAPSKNKRKKILLLDLRPNDAHPCEIYDRKKVCKDHMANGSMPITKLL